MPTNINSKKITFFAEAIKFVLMVFVLFILLARFCFSDPATSNQLVTIPAGEFRPLFAKPKEKSEKIRAFRMSVLPVTQRDFFEFVITHPQWQRENAKHLYVDENYLSQWQVNENAVTAPKADDMQKPVVNISWFAAKAFCAARNQRLPATAEWEYVAKASETDWDARKDKLFLEKILNWYARPQSMSLLTNVNQLPANKYGVKDLHNLIWEWTSDFNSVLSTGESRGDSTTDNQFFCGSGAAGAADPSDYASFMRYAMRTSLQATYSLNNLGFRCVEDIEVSP